MATKPGPRFRAGRIASSVIEVWRTKTDGDFDSKGGIMMPCYFFEYGIDGEG